MHETHTLLHIHQLRHTLLNPMQKRVKDEEEEEEEGKDVRLLSCTIFMQ